MLELTHVSIELDELGYWLFTLTVD